ncbi:hypothetical protein [Acinetobacter guillouiae]|uniref:hypothetical protein n=1 Tax=Acinetobacter guillouiae TaxID=106649 RepID=UPI00300AE070
MNLYDIFNPIQDVDYYEKSIVTNCFIHMLSDDNINLNIFYHLIENNGVGGDIDWGVEKWSVDSLTDHGIKDYYDGYLFYIGPEEHGKFDEGEWQVILKKEQIIPFISCIVNYYSNLENSNVDKFVLLAKNNGFY